MADLLRGLAAKPAPGVALGPSLIGWSALMCLAFDLVTQGRVLPEYIAHNQGVHAAWNAFPSERDRLFVNEVAEALPEWSWMEFKEKGQDGDPDRATVVAIALDNLTHLNMRQALLAATFWKVPNPPQERIRMKRLEAKIWKSGSLLAINKYIDLYGAAMLNRYIDKL
jgi:hypothetical protein